MTSTDSLQGLLDASLETFSQVDLVFANAGIGAGEAGPIWGFSEKDWQWCFNVNLWGAVNSINVFMPYLITRTDRTHDHYSPGNGAYTVLPDVPIYTATKAAVHTITENLHYQVKWVVCRSWSAPSPAHMWSRRALQLGQGPTR